MTPPSMRERFARVICNGANTRECCGQCGDMLWHADAVLAELETPTGAMIKAGALGHSPQRRHDMP